MTKPTTGASRPAIIGEVLFDRFPDGTQVLGGAPFNVAWHLQGFGAKPLFVSCVGDAFASVSLLGLLQGWPLATTWQRAQQFASRIVQQRGATSQDREMYSQLNSDPSYRSGSRLAVRNISAT